jgi:hypothetical protein
LATTFQKKDIQFYETSVADHACNLTGKTKPVGTLPYIINMAKEE